MEAGRNDDFAGFTWNAGISTNTAISPRSSLPGSSRQSIAPPHGPPGTSPVVTA